MVHDFILKCILAFLGENEYDYSSAVKTRNYDSHNISEALNAISNGVKITEVSRYYNIKRATLYYHMNKIKADFSQQDFEAAIVAQEPTNE